MTLIRNFALFCLVTTLIGCSGLRKSDKNDKETLVQISTSYGDMLIELSDKTPMHKANFIKLAKEGFYDSTLFHRVMEGFMIQGGDPDSKQAPIGTALGNGGPSYTVSAEFDTSLFHIKGALAAARQPDNVNPQKASSGSQFYLVQGKKYSVKELKNMERALKRRMPEYALTQEQVEAYTTVGGIPFLDKNYTVFGQVIKGINVIDSIASVPVNRKNNHRPIANVPMTMKVLWVSKKQKERLLKKED